MLAPLSWLKDYVDIDVPAKELERLLFSVGFEVEELIDTLENALLSFKAAAENKKVTFKMNSNEQALKSLQDMKNVFSGKGFAATKDTTNQDYATKKAEVERYIRKAKMYYSNNKTVNFLVAEVEAAIADAEKSITAAKK